MTQFARPDVDTAVGNWTASSGISLFDLINDAVVSDTDYITVTDDTVGTAEAITFSLSGVTDPAVGTGHSVVVRAHESGGSGFVTLNVNLKDGATSIKNENFTAGATPGNHTMTLSAVQADTISTGGYADLTLVITATDGSMSMTETRVYDAYLACPDAAAAATNNSQSFSLVADGAMGTSFSLVGDEELPANVRI